MTYEKIVTIMRDVYDREISRLGERQSLAGPVESFIIGIEGRRLDDFVGKVAAELAAESIKENQQ